MRLRPIALSLLALSAVSSYAQPSPEMIQKIVDEGKNRNQVMRQLRELTNIGPRLTGSPILAKAQDWAVKKFKSFGLTNVHKEQWGELPVGFVRGRRQEAKMISPEKRDLVFTTMNWTEGTKGRVKGEAVRAPETAAEVKASPETYKGKWILMKGPSSMRGPALNASLTEMKEALLWAGANGIVFGAADERVHSSGRFADKTFEKRPLGVEIIVRKSDAEAIGAQIDSGAKPQLQFNIENIWIKGPVPQYNVIAEIKGTEKPDEVVIVCGHQDSWNSPGSQGACDNGTGSSVAIEAARILSKVGAKPKRTIRFILWSGEEQGLLGSRAYVEAHANEMEKIVAVLNDDGGTNYQGGYQGIEAMRPMMEAAFAPTVAAFPDMPMKFQVMATMPKGGSSDHAAFTAKGVPGFFTIESGRGDYGYVWHTQNDRYENAIPEYLIQSSTNHAIVSYTLAMNEEMLPREPKAPVPPANAVTESVAGGLERFFTTVNLHDRGNDYASYLRFRLQRTWQALARTR